MHPTKIVMDTDVLVAAVRSSGGASRQWLARVERREVEMLCSVPLFLEYQAVLHRGHAGGSPRLVDRFLSVLASAVTPVDLHFRYRPQLPDPDDDVVLETAINGSAYGILTFNLKDFGPVPWRGFGIRVARPGPALTEWTHG